MIRENNSLEYSGEFLAVPTPLWRLLAFNPFFFWLIAALGGIGQFLLRRQIKAREYISPDAHSGCDKLLP